MGIHKELLIDEIEDPFKNVPNYFVSIHLFKNKLIYEYIKANGFDGICHYTGDFTKVLSLKSIIEFINGIISKYYGNPDDEAVGWDSGFENEHDNSTFHKELGGYIVPPGRHIYTDIEELLFDNQLLVDDDTLLMDIVSSLNGMNLIRKDPYGLSEDEERFLDWKYVAENSIKMSGMGMDFDDIIKQEKVRLYSLLSYIQTAKAPLMIKRALTLYRCVNYKEKLDDVKFENLTSPPVEFTQNLRMSRKGDSIFYGSFNKNTTLEEALGSNAEGFSYIGTFETIHDVCLLDLTGIDGYLSIFNQEESDYYNLAFLSRFCHEISKLVNNPSEEYIPTQFITYYFRNCLKYYHKNGLKSDLDGFLYRSSKNKKSINAALFYDSENSGNHLKLLEYETAIHK